MTLPLSLSRPQLASLLLEAFPPAALPPPASRSASWLPALPPVRPDALAHLVAFPPACTPAPMALFEGWSLQLPEYIRVSVGRAKARAGAPSACQQSNLGWSHLPCYGPTHRLRACVQGAATTTSTTPVAPFLSDSFCSGRQRWRRACRTALANTQVPRQAPNLLTSHEPAGPLIQPTQIHRSAYTIHNSPTAAALPHASHC